MDGDWVFEAIGTRWRLTTEAPLTDAVRRAVALRIDAFDRAWSRFRAGSVVDAVRATAGRHRMPDDAGPLLALYDRLHTATAGALSPAVGDGLEHLGYDAGYTLTARPGHRPAVDWGAVGWDAPYLETAKPFVLDVGAAGKGYLVDLVTDVVLGFAEHRTGGVTVDASGDLVHVPGGRRRALPGRPGAPGATRLRRRRRRARRRAGTSGALRVGHQPARLGRRSPPRARRAHRAARHRRARHLGRRRLRARRRRSRDRPLPARARRRGCSRRRGGCVVRPSRPRPR
ncbi:hypothetical protein QE405_000220 [Nocardioides zeae]|uniref:FAD:protein FMN transferase n=1 Tax=Nocardioides zeae TaxID=1457234 RepID=A0AAJ1WZP5_9ACTN|nr:FAD:protein FMN transferase [Nocardioides zeae]MDQ1102936.1 hypothetical protein [Nocardioides zeae]